MEYFISIFSIIMTTLTTIVVAAIGLYQKKIEKKNDDYQKLREENEKLLNEERKRSAQKEEERFTKIEQSVAQLSTDVSDLKNSIHLDDISKQLTQLHSLNELNFEYIQSLSGLVINVAESLGSPHSLSKGVRDKMNSETEKHRKTEDNITKRLYKFTV